MKLHELELARKAQKQSDKHFYFDDSGSILYYGRSESDEYVQSNHAVLSYEQCRIIEESPDKTVNDFLIIVDPTTEGVFTLVNKQIELESFKSATSMLSIVKKKTALTSVYDIKIEYTPADPLVNLIVSINEKLRANVTQNLDINNFTFKGVGFINLYFTTANDPHFMFDSIKVDLVKLFKEGKQVYKVSSELAECDLFTKKIFDKYEYKVTT
jgi:hypothetical protein